MSFPLILRRGSFGPLLRKRTASFVNIVPLNGPSFINRGLNVSMHDAERLEFVSTTSDTRRTATWSTPPSGTRVQFTVTTSHTLYFRVDDGTELGDTGYRDIIPSMPPGTHQVDVVLSFDPSVYPRFGFLTSTVPAAVSISNWRATPPVTPLSSFYGTGSGRIAIHLRADEAAKDETGSVTKLFNIGGAGALFNAPVSGAALVAGSPGTLQLSGTSGTPFLTQAASLMNVRLMWVCSTDALATAMRFFGSPGYEIRLGTFQPGNTNFIQYWSNITGSGISANPTPRAVIPTSGLHLFELETTASSVSFWIDGLLQSTSTAAFPWADFLIDRIGMGNGTAGLYVGNMGDVLGVTVGAGSAETVAAVRNYLAPRFGLTLS